MKKKLFFGMVAVALASCSSHDLVDNNSGPNSESSQNVAIGFNVSKQNMTRSTTALNELGHYNFGVWAYKSNAGENATVVMNHYLVGFSDATNKKGYYVDDTKTTTFGTNTGTGDHISPWFYEGLGTSEYTHATNGAGENYYTTGDANYDKYKSVNANQYLRYWDLAYANTDFYCYAPYNNAVTFNASTKTMTLPNSVLTDGYDDPQNNAYSGKNHNLGDFMYAGVRATNSALQDVEIPFKRVGAQVFIRFYENIPGYRVEIVNLGQDYTGTWASGVTADQKLGIQATPAILGGSPATYSNGTYAKAYNANVTFNLATTPTETFTPNFEGATNTSDNLMFKVPTSAAPSALPADIHSLTSWEGHNVIEEKVTSGTQKWSYSPTVYYPVAQNPSNGTGFTFHVTYKIIAKDNKEVITVHNAKVFVPATDGGTTSIARWQNNTRYTYTFLITKNTTGTTDPATDIDPTSPDATGTQALYPIVFDGATLEDFTELEKEYNIN